jgi:ABC-2 type transport system ATP-binding protein
MEELSMEYAIETKNLIKHYNHGKVHAVNGLNLKIRKGEIYAFIGANGSGKTTTIDMLSGVLMPTAGEMYIFGLEQPKYRKKISHYIGIAPQDYSLYFDLSVWENLVFFGKLFSLQKQEIKEIGENLLDILNLREKRDVVVEKLSGGMKRRLSIAVALIHQPSILLFDEATVGIDPILRAYFWDYFRKLRDLGKTILITSHVMDEAEKADRIGLIRAGILIEEGTPSELKVKHNVSSIEEIFINLSGEEYIDE